MPQLISRRHFLISSLGCTTACASSLQNFPFDQQVQRNRLGLQIQFYGVGCFRISYNGFDVLSDPFFSYLPFSQVAFGKIQSDPKQVDPYLPQLQNVKMVVVGHNHYDHNLDLAYIAPHLDSQAVIAGSKTLKTIQKTTLTPLITRSVSGPGRVNMQPFRFLCGPERDNLRGTTNEGPFLCVEKPQLFLGSTTAKTIQKCQ